MSGNVAVAALNRRHDTREYPVLPHELGSERATLDIAHDECARFCVNDLWRYAGSTRGLRGSKLVGPRHAVHGYVFSYPYHKPLAFMLDKEVGVRDAAFERYRFHGFSPALQLHRFAPGFLHACPLREP